MRPNKTRSIINLYHRWGKSYGLMPTAIAIALQRQGLIEILDDGLRYRETDTMRSLDNLDDTINGILTRLVKSAGKDIL